MRNLRNFGITFAVSLVLLGIVALFASGYVADAVTDIFNSHSKDLDKIINSEQAEVDNSAGETDERFTKPLEGESFTWLMVVSDKRTDVYEYYPSKSQIEKSTELGILGKDYKLDEAVAIGVVHADVTAREYVVLTIPTITKLETGSGTMTLGEMYAVYGIDYLREKIGSIIGMEIDYYTVVNSTNLTSLTSTIGAVECEIPVAIGFDGKEYVTYVEPTDDTTPQTTAPPETNADGETKKEEEEKEPEITSELDAATSVKLSKKLMAALLYRDYSDGINQEMLIVQSFVNGVLKNLSAMSDSSLNSCITGLKSTFSASNLTADAVSKHGEVIRAYTWLPTTNVVYTGRFAAGAGTKAPSYTPDVNEMVNYFYKYR